MWSWNEKCEEGLALPKFANLMQINSSFKQFF